MPCGGAEGPAEGGTGAHTHPSDGTAALGVVTGVTRVGTEGAPRVGGHVSQVGGGKGGHKRALPGPEEHCSALQGKLQSPALPAAALVTQQDPGLFPVGAQGWGFGHIPRGGAGGAGENWMHMIPFQRELHNTLVCRQCFLLPLSHLSSSQHGPIFSCC